MHENRAYVLENFEIDEDGKILTPGRFYREPLYAPYFYEVITNGEVGEFQVKKPPYLYVTYQIQGIDIEAFPELSGFYGVVCEVSDDIFRCFALNERHYRLMLRSLLLRRK